MQPAIDPDDDCLLNKLLKTVNLNSEPLFTIILMLNNWLVFNF